MSDSMLLRMADTMPDLLVISLPVPPPAAAAVEAVREQASAWLAGAEAHAPALLLGLALLLAVPPLALAGLAVRRLWAKDRPQDETAAGAGLDAPVGPVAAGRAWLEVEALPGYRVPIDGEIVRIGREDDNELCLESRAVHRYHAVVQRTDEQGFVITDVSSGNGVSVNGEKRAWSTLSHGDRLEIGGMAIRFHVRPAA